MSNPGERLIAPVVAAIDAAGDVAALRGAAQGIRDLVLQLLELDLGARGLTELISRLNDRLTTRLVALLAHEQRMDLGRACWLAFGSQGRAEQTVVTDQDNGLVFVSDAPDAERAAWLALGRRVNDALDACGYPLCRGNVMAGNPQCCLTQDEWCRRFSDWMEHGAPEDLLAASIFFDLRPIAGQLALARPLREHITRQAARLPRFIRQMALNALSHGAPLGWLGGIDGERIDLKMQGTTLFVDAARLYALAHGADATGTRARLQAAAAALGVPAHESEAWVAGFEFLQALRLRVQLSPGEAADDPNTLDVDTLNDLDRRVLIESLRAARRLQQRMQLDYER
jgi:CBS domain-containing protein